MPDDRAVTTEEERRAALERARRRRWLDEVFGASPSQTRDDAPDPGDPAERRTGSAADEERLRREVPPHHGTP
jgi:hypothetical protein